MPRNKPGRVRSMGERRTRLERQRLMVLTIVCDNDECGGRCIPPAYRRQAVPLSVEPWSLPHHPPPGQAQQ